MLIVQEQVDLTKAQRFFLSAYLEDYRERMSTKEKDKQEDEISAGLDNFIMQVIRYGKRIDNVDNRHQRTEHSDKSL